MTTKELNKAIEAFFSESKPKDCITYESIISLFEKQPTAAQAKNIYKLATKSKACLFTSSENAKRLNDKEAEARKDQLHEIRESTVDG